AAAEALRAADQAVAVARKAPPEAERTLGLARDQVDALAREAARRDARAQSLDETILRFEEERAEAGRLLAVAEQEAEARARSEILTAPVADARQAAAAAREAAANARSELDI